MTVSIGSKYEETLADRVSEIRTNKEKPIRFIPITDTPLYFNSIRIGTRWCVCNHCDHEPIYPEEPVYPVRRSDARPVSFIRDYCIREFW